MQKYISLFVCLCAFLVSTFAQAYSGLGAESVSPETLQKYAPKPISSELSRKIQLILDTRSPGLGMLSPDGKKLFFTWKVTGQTQIWRVDGPKSFPIQMTGGEDQTTIADMTPDGKWLLLSRDQKGEENPGLYLQNPAGGPLHVIQHTPKVQVHAQFVSQDSKYVYYTANDIKPDSYALYRYDIEARKRELVFGEDGLWSVSDHRPDGTLLMSKATGSLTSEHYEWSPNTRALTPVLGVGEKQEYNVRFAAKPGHYLVLTPKLGDFRRLYLYESVSQKFTPISPELKMNVEGFDIDEPRTRIYLSYNDKGYTKLEVRDAKNFKVIPLPLIPNQKNASHIIAGSLSRDGRYAVIGVESAQSPRVSYVLDWRGQKLSQWLIPSAPETNLSRFAIEKLEYYPARDGTMIPMFVKRPKGCEPGQSPAANGKPCPVIVDFHGGPEGQSVPRFSLQVQLFVDAGFVYVEPNVRGSDGYGKAWLDADNGAKRLNVITDIEDCARFIRKNWAINDAEPKIGITGGSYGGYSTLVGMTMFAGAYDAGVAIVGMSNLVTFLQNTAPYRRILRTTEYGDPEKDLEALKKLSPINYVDRIKAPLLVVQGVSDPRVPAGEAVQITTAALKRGVPAELILFADEGHGVAKRQNQVLYIGHALGFFEKYLK